VSSKLGAGHYDDEHTTNALPNWRGDVFIAEIIPSELERLKSAKLNIVSQSDLDILKKYSRE
jgi:hypothetical protein